jgi:hypothetical protein
MVAGGRDSAGIKREHGEAYPKGTETVAAPATVSGKPAAHATAPIAGGKARTGDDPRARRPAIQTQHFYPDGAFRED